LFLIKIYTKLYLNIKKNSIKLLDEYMMYFSSAMKRAYDLGLIDKKWVRDFCWSGGNNCVRKERFEKEGYASPNYVLPDESEDPKLKKVYKNRYE